MLQWLLLGGVAAAAVAGGKRRRVLLRSGETYRYVQRWRRIDDAAFERLWAYFQGRAPDLFNVTLISRAADGALISYDHTVSEDVVMTLPEGWFSLRFALGDTRAEGRLEDARLPEV